ncbi:Zf-TFIIB domain-containing protein [Sulfidibacter corallicola]|uniref:Zf-TFIIB domain-containing protein n=1 Tax=Sulfidibacter corallicola TaxID=2818388 RepID=A0A8A4TJ03_SULCO|nr:zf-TFIIB domain-containing protein [Sulfidibacter corallicola]QTD50009.1 zf-TFIIB domain-containing protein [Sulfidibacter corallicola]
MKCPICRHQSMVTVNLEDGPKAYHCGACEGDWIMANDYEYWLASREVAEESAHPLTQFEIQDSPVPKLCPTCRQILFKYRVRQDIQFHLDHCRGCGGVWFDKDEWKVLRSVNLHDEFYKIFTRAWQEKLKQLDQRDNFAKLYRDRFGEDDYAELRKIKAWVEAHPHQQLILGYLTSEDPYRP